MSRILVVEDDPALLRGLADNLAGEGYRVDPAEDGAAALTLIRRNAYDLVILDLMLPRLSGYELCRTLREGGDTTPVMMLTARGEEGDRVLGLDLGADDYVTKPFSLRELLARVRALLRRTTMSASLVDFLEFGRAQIDFRSYAATCGGQPVHLTRKEFSLLQHIASRPDEVLTRDMLLDQVWGHESYPSTRTVDNHVASLRAKLEADPANPRHLLTVFGVGYKWVGNAADNSVTSSSPDTGKINSPK